jgi:type III secretion system FlhB-like substrate exporter
MTDMMFGKSLQDIIAEAKELDARIKENPEILEEYKRNNPKLAEALEYEEIQERMQNSIKLSAQHVVLNVLSYIFR